MVSSASSLPASFRYALVHLTLRGFRFILKFLWHLLRQNLNTCGGSYKSGGGNYTPPESGLKRTLLSLRTNVIPWPGYTVLEQNQHFSRRMAAARADWRLPAVLSAVHHSLGGQAGEFDYLHPMGREMTATRGDKSGCAVRPMNEGKAEDCASNL